MIRMLVSIFACSIVLLNLVVADAGQARPIAFSLPGLQNNSLTEQQKELLKQLETDVLPQVESILSPEQRQQFETEISDGTNFRRAFKLLSLTPDQKAELGKLFKTLPKKDIFASLTLEQKKQLFVKKEVFAPTLEEIGEKMEIIEGQD